MFARVATLNVRGGEFFMRIAALQCRHKQEYQSISTVVGFIGLGNMGAPMATNLLKKGYKLAVYDVFPKSMVPFKEAGAIICSSPGEVAKQCGYVITMLPSNSTVLDAYQGKSGILESVNRSTTLIDSSTVDPNVSKTVASAAEEKGALFFDAPVSGGIMAAASANLTFIVGGDSETFPAVREILLGMGKKVFLCGPVGSGQAAKICNNMLLAISMVGTAEAMNLGIKLGLDPKTLMEVINACSGRCWSSEVYNPVPGTIPNIPSSQDYKAGFLTKLMVKDLSLALEAVSHCETVAPLGSLAHQLYRTMMLHGHADKDFSSVYEFLSGGNLKDSK